MNPSDLTGRPRETGQIFARLHQRVFSKKDSISLLRLLVEFSSLKKSLVVYDREDEYEFVRTRLECSPSKRQFMRKCSNLKNLYRSSLRKGAAAAGGLTGDDAVIFELSERLWGEEIMRQEKERERGRSARALNLEELSAVLGLGDVSLLKEGSDRVGDSCAESAGFEPESGLEAGKSSSTVSGKGGKRKRQDEPRKIGGMAANCSGHEVLDDGDGEFARLAKSSAKFGLEDGESARNVPRKKRKKCKGDDHSAKRQRSREEASCGEICNMENGNLAKVEDSRAKSGLMDGCRASYELMNKKKHKQVERSGELENSLERRLVNENDSLARSAAYSQLDKGKSSRKKKMHKGDEAAELKRLSESGSVDEGLNTIGKSTTLSKSRMKSGSEDGKLASNPVEQENKHRGDGKYLNLGNLLEKGSGSKKSITDDYGLVKLAKGIASSQLENARKKKKHKSDHKST